MSHSYVGVAGWTVPKQLSVRFAASGSHLERYASRLTAVEINSSFYRPHRRSTYERWAASVPGSFRFAVKLPKTITHEMRLIGCSDLLRRFADEVCGLGEKRGPVLVQLPPSIKFDDVLAEQFLGSAREHLGGAVVIEPRHASWFTEEANSLLVEQRVARAVADPAVVPYGATPGGWCGTCYFRLHGVPRVYWSNYSPSAIERHADLIRDLSEVSDEVWTIFDNTAAGHAPANALALVDDLYME